MHTTYSSSSYSAEVPFWTTIPDIHYIYASSGCSGYRPFDIFWFDIFLIVRRAKFSEQVEGV